MRCMNQTDRIETYFKRLDKLRHFPLYRLEPHVDVFFSLYLQEVLQTYLNEEIADVVIPEMPLNKGTIFEHEGYLHNDSKRVDFLLLSKDLSKAFLVELKTNEGSVNDRQAGYLEASCRYCLYQIVEGVVKIISKTEKKKKKKKYVHLLQALASAKLLKLPPSFLEDAYNGKSVTSAMLSQITINPSLHDTRLQVVYVKPKPGGRETVIDLTMSHDVVAQHDDPISKVFAEHLLKWRDTAGDRRPEECTEYSSDHE